jgi:hypothetical protein
MDISTFFKNGDPSYPTLGFDGGFKAIPINRFSDETYFEASGTRIYGAVPSGMSKGAAEGYKWAYTKWEAPMKRDCAELNKRIKATSENLAENKRLLEGGDMKKAAYIQGLEVALKEFNELAAASSCAINTPNDGLGGLNIEDPKGVSTGGWIAIIGSTVIVLGVVGYFLYKKYKK